MRFGACIRNSADINAIIRQREGRVEARFDSFCNLKREYFATINYLTKRSTNVLLLKADLRNDAFYCPLNKGLCPN